MLAEKSIFKFLQHWGLQVRIANGRHRKQVFEPFPALLGKILRDWKSFPVEQNLWAVLRNWLPDIERQRWFSDFADVNQWFAGSASIIFSMVVGSFEIVSKVETDANAGLTCIKEGRIEFVESLSGAVK